MVGLDDLQRHGHLSHWAQPNSAVDRSTRQDESSDSIISPAVMSNKPGGHSRKRQQSHGVRSLPSLLPGDEVRVKTQQQSDWSQKGVVSTPADTPRSFVVLTPAGGVYRQNRRHLQTDASSESTIPPIDVEPSVEPNVTTLSPTELPSSLSPVPRRSNRRAIKPDRLSVRVNTSL